MHYRCRRFSLLFPFQHASSSATGWHARTPARLPVRPSTSPPDRPTARSSARPFTHPPAACQTRRPAAIAPNAFALLALINPLVHILYKRLLLCRRNSHRAYCDKWQYKHIVDTWTDGRSDRRRERRTDGRTYRRRHRRSDGGTKWRVTNGRMDGRTDG